MKDRPFIAFCLGVIFAWFIELVTNDAAAILIDNEKRCSYRFPWSGQCVRRDGHRGVHY